MARSVVVACETCGLLFKAFPSQHKRYCSKKCYGTRLSKEKSGIPQPRFAGENNPNFGGRYSHDPEIREKMLKAIHERGGTWGEEECQIHSERMKSPKHNWMIGKQHRDETKRVLSEAQRKRWAEGEYEGVSHHQKRVSRAETEIQNLLSTTYPDTEFQKHFNGVSYQYDFFIPSLKLIIEYQGDYWHFNPKKYQAGSYVTRPHKGKVLVDDIWARDERKKSEAEGLGYVVAYFWESDFKEYGLGFILDLIETYKGNRI